MSEGLRHDEGKLRHDLIPPNPINELAKVLTFGAKKYADHNWMKGMKWSKVIGPLKRHLNAIERGEDHDSESGLLHAAHVMCNAMFLLEYYRIYPQGDDRIHNTVLKQPKIGLDIDEVIADFVPYYTTLFKAPIPTFWNFDALMAQRFEELAKNEDFWINVPAKVFAKDLPFEPHCFITSRSIPSELTAKWLKKHEFPTVPVYTVPRGESKVETAKKSGIDIFVDDSYTNFVELNNAGICTFLMDAPHNRKFNVGYKRIYSLQQLADWLNYTNTNTHAVTAETKTGNTFTGNNLVKGS